MLNSTTIKLGSTSQNVTFNSPSSGILQRSHPKSRMVVCHHGSKLADWLFADVPHICKYQYSSWSKDYEITVLQIMIYGNDRLIVEIVKNNDLIAEVSNLNPPEPRPTWSPEY